MKTQQTHRSGPAWAFTLLELLVVMSILGVLSALLLPTLGAAREKAKRIGCLSQVKQLVLASLVYAEDDSRKSLTARVGGDDQSLNYLWDRAAGTRRLFSCPSTRNQVRTNEALNLVTGERGLADLGELADSRYAEHGLSYLCHGFIGHDTPYAEEIPFLGRTRYLPYLRKNLSNIQSYRNWHNTFGLKGVMPGPSRYWLITDNYWIGGTTAYPDRADNHGARGLNVGYCDGHASWLPTSGFLYAYAMDTDEGRSSVALPY